MAIKKVETPFNKLARLKAEKARLETVLDGAGSEAFKARVNIELAEIELRIKTAELEVRTVKQLAKGCVTPSGKRIRV